MTVWLKQFDERIEQTLLIRVVEALKLWNNGQVTFSGKNQFQLLLKNQSLYLDPPLEKSRSIWMIALHAWLGIAVSLPRIQVFEYEKNLTSQGSTSSTNYFNLIGRLPRDEYKRAYVCIESMYTKVSDYVNQWLQYQSLWDLEPLVVYESLGLDIQKWCDTLMEVKKARSIFDTSETSCSLFGLNVDFKHVQSKVNTQYDVWQKDLLAKFGGIIGSSMKSFFETINEKRLLLESSSLSGSTNEAIQFVTVLQNLRNKNHEWEELIKSFQVGQKLLDKQRYHFPADWLYLDQVMGEWQAYQDIFTRKEKALMEQWGKMHLYRFS